MSTTPTRIWAAILVASAAWGTNGVATRAALNDGIPPVTIVSVRVMLASVALYVLLRLRGRHFPVRWSKWSSATVQGVFQLSIPFVLFNFAYENASAGFVGLFAALIPLGTAIVAHFMLPDEPLHLAKLVGLTVAFSGVGFLLLTGDSGLPDGGNPVVAAGFAVGAVSSVSYAGVYAKLHVHSFDPMELSFMQFVIGIFLIGAAMLILEGPPPAISAWGWLLIGYMTLVGSVTPFLLFFWLLGHVSATKASLVGYVVPVVALIAGITLLDEKLQAGIVVGGALIIVGVVLTDRAERRKFPAAPVP
jgi:drug/metabolite transporter (DMT)-like permease